jgi:thaumarchaeosortase
MHHSTRPTVRELFRRLGTADVFLIVSTIPVLVMFALAPETFGLSWAGFGKLGRGGLFFVLFFLAFEWFDFRKTAKSRLDKRRKVAVAALLLSAIIYSVAITIVPQFIDAVYWVGRVLGAAGEVSNSWLMAVDYLALTIYIAALAVAFFSPRAILAVFTAIVFSLGMMIMYLLDAFFPYGSLGPLQFWANFIVTGVSFLAWIFGLPIYGFGNQLTILGAHGTFRLLVYWPSVGVHSMLIYSLVMILLAAKLNAPAWRKIIYAAVGVAGTVFLNVTRIFLIAYYGFAYATSGQDLDAFHNSIGEILFPIWIVAFLLVILSVEGRLANRKRRAMLKANQIDQGPPTDSAATEARRRE